MFSKSSLKSRITKLEEEKNQLQIEQTDFLTKVEKLEAENTQLREQLQQYWQILFNSEQEVDKLTKKTSHLRSRYEHYKKRSQALQTENKNLNDHLRHAISKSRSQSRHRSRKHEKRRVTILTEDNQIVSPRSENTNTIDSEDDSSQS